MLILTNKDGEIVGHFLNSKTAFECCWAMYQLDPESKIWGLDETPEQKRLIDRNATEWMVVQFNQKPIANWIRPIDEARGVMFRKHSGNKNPKIRYRMYKPIIMNELLKAIRFPALKRMAGDLIERYPNIRTPKG